MKFQVFAPAAIAISLTFASSAHAACLPNVLPAFASFVFANGFQQQDCEAVPVQLSVSGPSLIGNAGATATSSLNPNARVDADYTSPFALQGASEGFAETSFQDRSDFWSQERRAPRSCPSRSASPDRSPLWEQGQKFV
jgi:hypothetical protein